MRLWEGQGQRRRLLVFSIGCVLTALGTGALGLGGAEALHSLGKSPWMMDGRSTVSLTSPHGLMACALMAVTGALVKWSGTTLTAYSGARISGEFGRTLRRDLLTQWFARLGHADQRPRTSDALAMLTLRATEAEKAISEGLFRMVRGALSFAPLVVVLVLSTPRYAWVALVVMALFSLVLGRARRAFRARHEAMQSRVDAYVGAADEATKHGELWVTFGATAWVLRSLDRLSRELSVLRAKSDALSASLSSSNEVLAAAAVLVGAAILRWQAHGSGQAPEAHDAELVRASVLVFVGYGPLREWTEGRLAYAKGSAALGDWSAFMTRKASGRAADDGASSSSSPPRVWPEGELRLEGVASKFGRASVTVRIPFGTTLALRGPTGAGKTSLLRVLLGLEPAADGHVYYANENLTRMGTGPSERPFAWAPQEAPLVAGTLGENTRLGRDEVAAKDAKDDRALLARILGEVPHEDGPVGAGGASLSGGERAWVSLARAIASELPVLLLDEPTASLDAESQARYLDVLRALKGERTVILVTHREEPLAVADQVVEFGTAKG